MAAIDSSIVNVSLPVIRNQFQVDVDEVGWVITAYMVSFCLFIPLTNWLKSRIGYYKLFLISVTVFTFGSLLCSLSHSLTMLVIARVIQAGGGGAISPTSLAILSDSFPQDERGSAIGWWGIGNVMGPALGPTLGGLLTQYFGWQSIFYVNIPIGIATILLTVKYLDYLKKEPVSKPAFDVTGFAFFSIFVVSLQYTISAISKNGGFSWQLLCGLAVSILSLWRFIRSSRKADALLDLSVFRSRMFVNCAIIILIRSLALYGGLFFLPFLLQGLMGYSEIQSGLLLLPNALMMLISRPFAGRMADKGFIRNTSITGLILVSASMIFFSLLKADTAIWVILVPMVIRGLGMSLLVAPVSTALLNAVSVQQTATATSMNSLLQQLGGSVGIAISGVVHVLIYNYNLKLHYTAEVAERHALMYGFISSGILIAIAIIPARKLPQAQSMAAA